MLEELKTKYEKYSDVELNNILGNLKGYTEVAKEALNSVIEERGGKEELQRRLNENQTILIEKNRIANETKKLISKHTDADFLKSMISSDILTKNEKDKIIDKHYLSFQHELKDKSISSRTIFGSVFGIIISSIISGIIYGIQLITMARIFSLIIFGLALINYGIIRLLTNQSKYNKVVLIAVLIATGISILIGDFLYHYFGYQGPKLK